jgi:hypothetical protein
MIVHHVMVEADGSIRQQGHGHFRAHEAIRVADGCTLLAFTDDPKVSAQTHRYDFASKTFVSHHAV